MISLKPLMFEPFVKMRAIVIIGFPCPPLSWPEITKAKNIANEIKAHWEELPAGNAGL